MTLKSTTAASWSAALLVLATADLTPTDLRAAEPPAIDVTVQVDFGPDVGQNFGTLFEARDQQGRTVAGAGFQGLYNTTCRNDRRTIQFFVRPVGEANRRVEQLPRFSADTGVYVGDLNGRLLARPQRVEQRAQTWNSQEGVWETAPEYANGPLSNGDGSMHLGDGVLSFLRSRIEYNGRLILTAPENESFHHVYYANGHLFFFHDRRGNDDSDSLTRIMAVPWSPTQTGPADYTKAISQPTTTPHQTTWAWGQLRGKVLTVTNWGGVYAFDGNAWKTLRTPDGKSYQVYSMLNYYDRLLLGHYPSGCLYEYDGEQIKPQVNWPPSLPGVASYSREAQAMALYRGDLYAAVWPWAELWRFDRQARQWTAIGRMFTRPELTDKVGHPFEAEIIAFNAAQNVKHVTNDWGQRATSLAVVGDALYIGTSNKGGTPRPPGYTFIDDAMLGEYGLVHRLRLPGQLSAQVQWKNGPTRLQFLVADGFARLLQDGQELASSPVSSELAAALRDPNITWGHGVFGPLAGKLLEHSP